MFCILIPGTWKNVCLHFFHQVYISLSKCDIKDILKVVLIIVHTNLVFINLSATFSSFSVFAEFSLMHHVILIIDFNWAAQIHALFIRLSAFLLFIKNLKWQLLHLSFKSAREWQWCEGILRMQSCTVELKVSLIYSFLIKQVIYCSFTERVKINNLQKIFIDIYTGIKSILLKKTGFCIIKLWIKIYIYIYMPVI